VVLPSQLTLQPFLPVFGQVGFFDQLVDIVIEIGVVEMQLRRPVLVEQRHRRAVFHRLLKVIDRHVIAEHLARAFFSRDQRRAGEREKKRVGQRRAHIERQRIVLRAMRLVGEHDHIAPIAEQLRRLELVNQREDISIVARQHLAQLRAGLGVTDVGIAHRAASGECLGDLLIEFHTISDDHEGPIARNFAQDLLRKENHRKAFARALRLPKDTAAPVARFARRQRRAYRIVDAKVLMILRNGFD
jgi:hypothetical protein